MGWWRMAPYFWSERKPIALALGLLVPVAFGNALQPLLLGQAVSLLRQEPILPWLQQLGATSSLKAAHQTTGPHHGHGFGVARATQLYGAKRGSVDDGPHPQ